MGSFVQSSLGSGEQVLLEAKQHWVIFVVPGLLTVLGVIIGDAGLLLSVVGGIMLLAKAAQFMTTELAVTNKKVVAKLILSRMVGAGSVTVNGSGLVATPIPGIEDPLGFSRTVNDAMEKAEAPSHPTT